MRKNIRVIAAALLLMAATGCLKDDGFDNQEYGTQVREVKAVSLPEARAGIVGVEVEPVNGPIVLGGPFIAIENETPPSADLTIELEEAPALVTGAGLTPFPAGFYTINQLSAVIKAGERDTEDIQVTLTNPSLLDPAVSYGIAFRIKSASGGYIVAKNLREVVYSIAIE